MKAKRVLAFLLAALMIVSLAACGKTEDTKPVDTRTYIYWLNFKPELDATLQELAATYAEAKKIDVKVVTPPSGEYGSTLSAQLESDDPPTMFVLGNNSDVKTYDKYLADLKGTDIQKELNSDNYNLYDGSKIAAIGYCYECFGIIVNPELVQLAGYKASDIKDFASLKAAVEYIHNNASWLGFDAFSSCAMNESNAWRFTGHMANLEYFYDERDEGGWSEAPSSIRGRYTENFKNLYDLCINNCRTSPDKLNSENLNPINEFKLRESAFCLGGSWDYAEISETVPGAIMIPLYSGMDGEDRAGLCCGTENYWAVNDKVSKSAQEATLKFMYWLVTNDKASAALVKQLGVMPYRNVPASENTFLKNADAYTSKGNYVMDWAFRYQPNSEEYRADLRSALINYNSDQTDANWENVKKALTDGWAQQYSKQNESK